MMLRLVMAWALRHDGKVDKALAAVDDMLDDIDGKNSITELDRNATWALWLETVLAAKRRPRARAGNVDVGWALANALHKDNIQPEQFDIIMAALSDDTQSVVAATVAIATAGLGFEMPPEHDPRRYVDEELLAPITRFIAEQATRSAANADS